MMDAQSNVEYREELLQEMRDMVDRGTNVRSLVSLLQSRLSLDDEAILPVLVYFRRAFSVSLLDILPIREWLGSDRDQEIDDEVMPKILKARTKRLQPSS